MKKIFKNVMALVLVAVVTAGTGYAVMANELQNQNWQNCNQAQIWRMEGAIGVSNCQMGRLMRNEEGAFLSREAFEVRLDALVADGIIAAADRAFFLERFDFCIESCQDNGQRMNGNCRGLRTQGRNCRNR